MSNLDRAYEAALAAAARSHGPRYIRFGEIPRRASGVSESYRLAVQARTGHLPPARERGVSVFPTYFSDVVKRYVLLEAHGWASTLAELWADFLDGRAQAILVSGRTAGEGSDGEPVLRARSIKRLGKLAPTDVWAEGQINRWNDGDEDVLPPGMNQAERSAFRKAILEEARRLR